MSVRLGIVGCGSVFWTPYMSLIERLRGQGRVEVVAVYDTDPGEAPARGGAARPQPRPAVRHARSASTPTSTSSSCSRACRSTAAWRARRSRRASTCSSRSRWRRRSRRPSRCSAAAEDAPGPPALRAAHPALPHLPRDARARRRGHDRRAAHRARPLRLGGAGLEPLVLRAGRRRALRPRRLQRHQPVRLLRAGAAGDGDDRRGDPRAADRRRADAGCRPRTTRTC